jgi:hypothetical protein
MWKLAVAVASIGLGCATSGETGKPIVEFPSAAKLAAVETNAVALPAIITGELPAEGWTIDAAFVPASADEPWTPQGGWDQAFAAVYAAAARKAKLTRAMSCVASEIGRFTLLQRAPPPEPLQRFITAGCGVATPGVGFRSLTGAVPDTVSDDALLQQWQSQLRTDVLDNVPANAREIGFWFGRRAGQVVALATYHATPVQLKPFSVVPNPAGEVVLEGQLDGDAAYFGGYANQGRFGVSACLVDPAVPRPRFRVTCRVAPEDQTAWLEVVYASTASVLAVPIVQLLARRDITQPLVFSETPYASSRPVADASGVAPAILAELNRVRVAAGLRPVQLAAAQSATASRVARHYFAAALDGAGKPNALADMNTVALGLLAGWQVAGTIREGTFFSVVVPHTRDAGRWLDTALATPIGREALLSPDIEEVALGSALFDKPHGIGAVVTGYRFHRSDDHRADVVRLMQRVVAARKRMQLSTPSRLGGVDAILARELDRVRTGVQLPMHALQASLEGAVNSYGVNMRGFVIEAISLDALEIPPEIIGHPNLALEIGVTHYKPPGAAWAQLVIVVVYKDVATTEA